MARTKVHGEYLDPSVISAQTEVTAVGSDHMLIFDATDNALKKALLSDLIETVGSTPTFTSLTVDDITINDSTISDSGDLTLDVGGDIILDADGGDIKIKDGGTDVGIISVVNSDRMVFATADGLGLQFDKDNNRIIPCDAAGAYNNNVELGDSSLEFTNLWLSNNAYIGNAVGIGTTSPSEKLDVNGGGLIVRGALTNGVGSGNGLRFEHTSDIGQIYSLEPNVAWRELRLNASQQTFYIANGEKMRLDSSGRFMVGSTSAFDSSSFCVDQSGLGQFRRDGTPLIIRRDGSDGGLIDFEKDGSTVGSIGSKNGDLLIGTTDVGLRFHDSGDNIRPANVDTGLVRDAAVDLGLAAGRFKDLYLSGGAYIGGTTSANHLDDYEEGTYIPTWSATVGNPSSYRNADNTSNTSTNGLSYVKIGRQVTVSGAVFFTGGSSINNTRPFMSLPFAARVYSVSGAMSSYQTGSQFDVNYLNYSSTTSINLFKLDSSGSHVSFGANGAIELYINITYQTYA